VERVDYLDTFIAVSDDCLAGEGTPPPVNPDRPSVVAHLAKRYGWGIHCDARGRVALLGVDTPEYQDFVSGNRQSASGLPVTVTKAMRRSRITR